MNNYTKKLLVIASFVVAAILMVLAMPREGQFKYQYQKGSPWMYNSLDASFDFPILKTEEEIRAEREKLLQDFTPYFTLRPDIEAEQLRNYNNEIIATPETEALKEKILTLLKEVYNTGIMSQVKMSEMNPEVGVAILRGNVAEKVPISDIYTPQTASAYIAAQLSGTASTIDITLYIAPNLIYDQTTTQAIQATTVQDISLTKGIVHTGQRLISEGEVVTSTTEQILDSLRAEYHSRIGFSGNLFLLLIGQSLIIALCMLLTFILLQSTRPQALQSIPELFFILCLSILVIGGASVAYRVNPNILYLLPFPVIVLFMDSFFPTRVSLPLYIIFLLPLLFITESYPLVICNIIAGAVAVYVFRFWGHGWQQFLSVSIVFTSYALVELAFHLISEGTFNNINWSIFRNYAISSILIIACYPLVFLFEKMFGFVSISRLRDLADTGNKVLRELSEKAPGTMQHAMQVANLAETAARKIDAYALLCRVGALYHDIGKINNPQYFVENQSSGFNPHTLLSPQESAHIVIQHVEDGISLGKKYGLPSLIIQFIASHHGQTRTEYFYNVFCNAGGDPSHTEEFTYPGQLPTSKEQVIVMIADAVEASCRSLKSYTPESISNMVDNVIKHRVSEEQLRNADITYRDLHRIQDIFKIRIQEIYHSRITYPTNKRLK